MSKGSNAMVVQSSNDFACAADRLMNKTTVCHISQEQIDQHRDSNDLWRDMAQVNGILRMHVAQCSYDGVHLYENAKMSKPFLSMYQLDNTISMDTPKSAEVNDSLAIGEWCVIKYDGEEFPVEVIGKIGD